MNSNKHIVLLTPGFPRDESDSTCIPPFQRFVQDLQQTYPENRISIIALQYPDRGEPYLWHGIPVYPIQGQNRRFPRRLFTWQKAMNTFALIHREYPVDGIHSFWLNEATLLGQRIQKRYGIPLIATIMGQDPLPENKYLNWIKLDKLILVSISERASLHLQQHTGRKADHLIPWGLDLPIQAEVPGLAQRNIDLLGVGSWVPVKQFTDFLTVLQGIIEVKSDVRAVLIGAGMTAQNLQGIVREKGLSKHLELRGELPREVVLETMQRARILLHPAIYEGQGYVFSEALAAGMCIVSRPVGAAVASNRWNLAPSIPLMTKACLQLFQHPPDPQPHELFAMKETVHAYARLYKWTD